MWEKARRKVEAFLDCRCTVEGFTQVETEWGETLTEEKILIPDMACRVIQKTGTRRQEGLVFHGEEKGRLLFPVGNSIPSGSRITVVFPDDTVGRYTAEGETAIFNTHKAVDMKRQGRN